MPTGTCPECDADVQVDADAETKDTIDCEECGVELEVVGLDPIELEVADDESFDDDDDDDEF